MNFLSGFARRITKSRLCVLLAVVLTCLAVGFSRRRSASDVRQDVEIGEELDRLVKDTLDETEKVREAIDKAHREMQETSAGTRKKVKKIQELAPEQAEDEWNAQVQQYNRRRTDR